MIALLAMPVMSTKLTLYRKVGGSRSRMILLTLVRKSERIQATWDEVDFENATWAIPKPRMNLNSAVEATTTRTTA